MIRKLIDFSVSYQKKEGKSLYRKKHSKDLSSTVSPFGSRKLRVKSAYGTDNYTVSRKKRPMNESAVDNLRDIEIPPMK